jgi:hypothetical protein
MTKDEYNDVRTGEVHAYMYIYHSSFDVLKQSAPVLPL